MTHECFLFVWLFFCCFMSCNTALSSALEQVRLTISYTRLILGLFSQPQRHWKPQLVRTMCFKSVFMAVVYCTEMAITAVTRVTTHGNGQSQLLYNFKPFPAAKANLLHNWFNICMSQAWFRVVWHQFGLYRWMQMACWRCFINVYVLGWFPLYQGNLQKLTVASVLWFFFLLSRAICHTKCCQQGLK